ncbi:MAG: hypothetical protein DRI01_09640, partial [Chloroflexi bacterium]
QSFTWDFSLPCGSFEFKLVLKDGFDQEERILVENPCQEELYLENISEIQGKAVVGKPVKWIKKVVIYNKGNKTEKGKKIQVKTPVGIKEVLIPEIGPGEKMTLNITYETSPPQKYEEIITPFSSEGFMKRLVVYHNDSVHYTNVLVNSSYPEELDGWVQVWLKDGTKIYDQLWGINDPRYNITAVDTDGNGLNDTLIINVPYLSSEEFYFGSSICRYSVDDVGFSVSGGSAGSSQTFYWVPAETCPGGTSNCRLTNISVYRRYVNTKTPIGDAGYKIQNPHNTTWYYPTYRETAVPTAGGILGPDWVCNETEGTLPSDYGGDTCTIDGLNFNVTNYTTVVVAGKNNVVDIFKINYTWCYVYQKPNLAGGNVTPATGGWGELFNFSVNVSDPQGDVVNVSVLIFKTGWTEWYYLNSSFVNTSLYGCTGTPNCTVYVIYGGFEKGDISSYEYMFNATDDDGYVENLTSTSFVFTVEKDDVIVYNETPAPSATINRSQTTEFAARYYDADRGVWITDGVLGRIWITTTDVATWDDGYLGTTNSLGYLNRTMTSSDWCSGNYPLGAHKWKAGVDSAETYYKLYNTSALDFTLVGDLLNTYISPTGGANYAQGDTVVFQGNVTDDCGNPVEGANVYFEINGTAGDYRCPSSGYVQSGADGSVTCNWDSSGAAGGYYNVTMKSLKNNYNDGYAFEENAFKLTVPPSLTNPRVSPSTGGWSLNRTFAVNVTDPGDNVTVMLWKSDSALGPWTKVEPTLYCYDCNNQVLEWNESYTCDDRGTWYYKFNATDLDGNTDETAVNSFIVDKDNIQLLYISGNGTEATKETPALFVLLANDTDANQVISGISVEFYVTTDQTTYRYDGYNTTNSSGYVSYYFYANCYYNPGLQYWKGKVSSTEQCYQSGYSDESNVTLIIQCPQFNVTRIYSPREVFQYELFAVNATIKVTDGNATGTNATIFTEGWQESPSKVIFLGN